MDEHFIDAMAYQPTRNPVQYQPINRISVEEVGKTANSLAQMHLDSFKVQTEYEKAIYALPLNEKDEIYRQQVVDAIKEEVNNLRADGDLVGDYERIVNFCTNIMHSKEMRGRLKTNAEYQDWIKNLKSLKLPKSYEEYYIEKNPYEYNDTEDGTMPTWKPKIDVTPTPDESKVIELAIKWLNPNKSGGFINTYLTDANGQKLEDWKKGGFVIDGDGYKVWLPPEKIHSAIRTVIRNNPQVLDGYWSMYNINKWYDEKHQNKDEYDYARQIPNNSEGYTMNFNEWLDWRFKPIEDNISYYEGYPPTAAMRNKEAGITTSRGSGSKNNNSSKDPAKQAAKIEKEQINSVTNTLIQKGVDTKKAKAEATKIVKSNKSSSSASSRVSDTSNKGGRRTPRTNLGG